MALGLFGLLSPVIYRHSVHRPAGMIALVYVLLYILLFSRTLTNFVIGAHVRYLMPDIILLGFNILSFLRRPLSDEKDRRFVLLLAGLALQTLLIAVAFMVQPDQTDAILSRGINTFYNLRNEWTAFFLILGLLVMTWFGRHHTASYIHRHCRRFWRGP
ncbi:MAG: hypothetical protein QF879_12875 [Candidatus Latescibacteria bacterium]|nr:hypothetical protein [Candidatus Latescibacterota bacterium]